MSTVLVTGGTGVLGQLVVARLREQGEELRVLSRRAGAGTHVGDLNTGVGVADAVRGADLIVHAASDTQRFGRADIEQTEHLLDAARDARHLLYVSIVGIERIPYGYYRRKLACEQRIASSGIPYTILRATQFHELIALVLRGAERLPLAPLPLDFRFQTVAAADLAERITELIRGQPARRVLNFGGPEVMTLGQMAEAWRSARGRPRRLVRLPVWGEVAEAFREGRNTCPEQADGRQGWAQFVASEPPNPYRIKVIPSPAAGNTRRWFVAADRLVNRATGTIVRVGLGPPTYALLETTGRRSGRPRQVPVANGLQGDTFWLIAGLGEQAQYVRNIKAKPRVRVKTRPARLREGLRMRWRSGTAHLMPEDDAHERHRQLGRGRPGYRLDGILLRALAARGSGTMLTIRIELDQAHSAGDGRST